MFNSGWMETKSTRGFEEWKEHKETLPPLRNTILPFFSSFLPFIVLSLSFPPISPRLSISTPTSNSQVQLDPYPTPLPYFPFPFPQLHFFHPNTTKSHKLTTSTPPSESKQLSLPETSLQAIIHLFVIVTWPNRDGSRGICEHSIGRRLVGSFNKAQANE